MATAKGATVGTRTAVREKSSARLLKGTDLKAAIVTRPVPLGTRIAMATRTAREVSTGASVNRLPGICSGKRPREVRAFKQPQKESNRRANCLRVRLTPTVDQREE